MHLMTHQPKNDVGTALASAMHRFLDEEMPAANPWWHFTFTTTHANGHLTLDPAPMAASRGGGGSDASGLAELRRRLADRSDVRQALDDVGSTLSLAVGTQVTLQLSQGGGIVSTPDTNGD